MVKYNINNIIIKYHNNNKYIITGKIKKCITMKGNYPTEKKSAGFCMLKVQIKVLLTEHIQF